MTYVLIEVDNCLLAPLCNNHKQTTKNTILEPAQEGLGSSIDYIMERLCHLGEIGVERISLSVIDTPDNLAAFLFSVEDPVFNKVALKANVETNFSLYTKKDLATVILDELKNDQESLKNSVFLNSVLIH